MVSRVLRSSRLPPRFRARPPHVMRIPDVVRLSYRLPLSKSARGNIYSVPRTTERAFRARQYLYTCTAWRGRNSIFSEPVREEEKASKNEGGVTEAGATICGLTVSTTPSVKRPRGVRVLVTPFCALSVAPEGEGGSCRRSPRLFHVATKVIKRRAEVARGPLFTLNDTSRHFIADGTLKARPFRPDTL